MEQSGRRAAGERDWRLGKNDSAQTPHTRSLRRSSFIRALCEGRGKCVSPKHCLSFSFPFHLRETDYQQERQDKTNEQRRPKKPALSHSAEEKGKEERDPLIDSFVL